jgi:hypothetical protein
LHEDELLHVGRALLERDALAEDWNVHTVVRLTVLTETLWMEGVGTGRYVRPVQATSMSLPLKHDGVAVELLLTYVEDFADDAASVGQLDGVGYLVGHLISNN